MSKIEIYQAKNGQTNIDVKFDKNTIWLALNQMSNLFNHDKSIMSKHLKKIFFEGKLISNSVVAKNEKTASDNKIYNVDFYNLDAIISVGYRVNSVEGTQFRQWAIQRLKEHLVNGYSINQKKLEQLQKTIEIIQNTANDENLNLDEAKGLLEIIKNYTQSFVLLNQFDSNNLIDSGLAENIIYEIATNNKFIANKHQ